MLCTPCRFIGTALFAINLRPLGKLRILVKYGNFMGPGRQSYLNELLDGGAITKMRKTA